MGSGILAFFAVTCPVCNKLVLALIGSSGASGWFASAQPVLGIAAVGLAAAALVVRVSSDPQRCMSDRDAGRTPHSI